jgi:hypothetical protein
VRGRPPAPPGRSDGPDMPPGRNPSDSWLVLRVMVRIGESTTSSKRDGCGGRLLAPVPTAPSATRGPGCRQARRPMVKLSIRRPCGSPARRAPPRVGNPPTSAALGLFHAPLENVRPPHPPEKFAIETAAPFWPL